MPTVDIDDEYLIGAASGAFATPTLKDLGDTWSFLRVLEKALLDNCARRGFTRRYSPDGRLYPESTPGGEVLVREMPTSRDWETGWAVFRVIERALLDDAAQRGIARQYAADGRPWAGEPEGDIVVEGGLPCIEDITRTLSVLRVATKALRDDAVRRQSDPQQAPESYRIRTFL
jgi:hypothetical protein